MCVGGGVVSCGSGTGQAVRQLGGDDLVAARGVMMVAKQIGSAWHAIPTARMSKTKGVIIPQLVDPNPQMDLQEICQKTWVSSLVDSHLSKPQSKQGCWMHMIKLMGEQLGGRQRMGK